MIYYGLVSLDDKGRILVRLFLQQIGMPHFLTISDFIMVRKFIDLQCNALY